MTSLIGTMFGLLYLVYLTAQTHAQFPRACAGMEAYLSHECCPLLNGSKCGVDEGRGICSDIVIDDQPWGGPYVLVGIDDRERWPERFFNRYVTDDDDVMTCIYDVMLTSLLLDLVNVQITLVDSIVHLVSSVGQEKTVIKCDL